MVDDQDTCRCEWVNVSFLLVPTHPGSHGQRAVKTVVTVTSAVVLVC